MDVMIHEDADGWSRSGIAYEKPRLVIVKDDEPQEEIAEEEKRKPVFEW